MTERRSKEIIRQNQDKIDKVDIHDIDMTAYRSEGQKKLLASIGETLQETLDLISNETFQELSELKVI